MSSYIWHVSADIPHVVVNDVTLRLLLVSRLIEVVVIFMIHYVKQLAIRGVLFVFLGILFEFCLAKILIVRGFLNNDISLALLH